MYTKRNVSQHEYDIYKTVVELSIVNIPPIISYDADEKILVTERVGEMNVADMYGDKITDQPAYIIEGIRDIISALYKNGIIYPDITGYNFIEGDRKIWIVDFGHATYVNRFVLGFINGETAWNPDFH